MDPQITAALITVAAGAAGAAGSGLTVVSRTGWVERLFSKRGKHSLIGTWISEWGPYPEGPVENQDFIVITKHFGEQISGYAFSEVEKTHRWHIEGRYIKERFLQIIYYPAQDSHDPHFLSLLVPFCRTNAGRKLFPGLLHWIRDGRTWPHTTRNRVWISDA